MCRGSSFRTDVLRNVNLTRLPSQDLAQVVFRQGFASELDDPGHPVAGQVLPAMFEQSLFSERRILPDNDSLDDLA